jgi:hypothetical protein
MSDSRQARRWIEETGADAVITDKASAKKIALSLLRGWRRYKVTGICPWTGVKLYDYTCFLHAFAERYAGPDDDLYTWLTKGGLRILDALQTQETLSAPNIFCPVCGRVLTNNNGADKGDLWVSAQGKSWCRECSEVFSLKR